MRSEEKTILKRIRILEHAKESKNVSYTCKYFGISRETFYQWKRAYESGGIEALKSRKRGAKNGTHPSKTPKRIENKILFMRKKYNWGPMNISTHLYKQFGIKITSGGVYQVLKRNGLNQLPPS